MICMLQMSISLSPGLGNRKTLKVTVQLDCSIGFLPAHPCIKLLLSAVVIMKAGILLASCQPE